MTNSMSVFNSTLHVGQERVSKLEYRAEKII